MAAADDLFAELQQISAELAGLAGGDPRRRELEEQRDRVRSKARLRHLAMSDPTALGKELAHLKRRLAALEQEKVQIPKWQKQVGGYLTKPEAAGRNINRKLDEVNARDRASLERRVAEIEDILGEGTAP